MSGDKWITIHADNYNVGEIVKVTGKKSWFIAEDPSVNTDNFSRTAHVPHIFLRGNELRKSIKTKIDDVAVWSH